MDYVIITWKYERLVGLDNDVVEEDAIQRAEIDLEEYEGDYATIHTVENGKLKEIRRIHRDPANK